MIVEFLKSCLDKLDLNRDGRGDVQQLKEAVEQLQKSLEHAAKEMDYKSLIVHAKSIVEALQAVSFYLSEIQKTVSTPEVQQAINDLKLTIHSIGKLITSFAEKK